MFISSCSLLTCDSPETLETFTTILCNVVEKLLGKAVQQIMNSHFEFPYQLFINMFLCLFWLIFLKINQDIDQIEANLSSSVVLYVTAFKTDVCLITVIYCIFLFTWVGCW